MAFEPLSDVFAHIKYARVLTQGGGLGNTVESHKNWALKEDEFTAIRALRDELNMLSDQLEQVTGNLPWLFATVKTVRLKTQDQLPGNFDEHVNWAAHHSESEVKNEIRSDIAIIKTKYGL